MLKDFINSRSAGLFLILLLVSTIISVGFIYKQYKVYEEGIFNKLESLYSLVSKSVLDRMIQYELVLNVLGTRLAEVNLDTEKTKMILNDALRSNPSFVAYGIADINGNIVSSSDNLQGSSFPNLLEADDSAATFRRALESDSMVVGNTYYFQPIEQWVIPLRLTIRDINGAPLFVITSGIDLESEFNPWSLGEFDDSMHLSVWHPADKNGDYYLIFTEFQNRLDLPYEMYSRPISVSYVEQTNKTLLDNYGITLNKPELVESPVGYVGPSNDRVIVAFDKKYRLFYALSSESISLETSIYRTSLWVGLVFLIVNLLTFVLLYKLHESQVTTQRKLSRKLVTDELTGLHNRYYLKEKLNFLRVKPSIELTIFLINLDNFKYINDYFGHRLADLVLIKLALRIVHSVPEKAGVIRLGGDEFLILIESEVLVEPMVLAEQLKTAISKDMFIDGIDVSVTASIGLVTCDSSTSLDEMLINATLALREAKNLKNSISAYTDDLRDENLRRAEIESRLKGAISKSELSLVYQPLIDMKSGEIKGVETLLRWTNTKLGNVSPAEFVPIAETSGQMIDIGKFVIDSAFKDYANIIGPNISLSINLSAQQFLQNDFVSYMKNTAEKYKVDCKKVVLEITESIFIEDVGQINQMIDQLNDYGFSVSLDDFGTGYSSLSSLQQTKFNELKIDRSFLHGIQSNQTAQEILKYIIQIGQACGKTIVAEGIETQEDLSIIKSFGCDTGQGYFWAKPMAVSDLKHFANKS